MNSTVTRNIASANTIQEAYKNQVIIDVIKKGGTIVDALIKILK
jgi:RNase P/RNase MRP subunit POP5